MPAALGAGGETVVSSALRELESRASSASFMAPSSSTSHVREGAQRPAPPRTGNWCRCGRGLVARYLEASFSCGTGRGGRHVQRCRPSEAVSVARVRTRRRRLCDSGGHRGGHPCPWAPSTGASACASKATTTRRKRSKAVAGGGRGRLRADVRRAARGGWNSCRRASRGRWGHRRRKHPIISRATSLVVTCRPYSPATGRSRDHAARL